MRAASDLQLSTTTEERRLWCMDRAGQGRAASPEMRAASDSQLSTTTAGKRLWCMDRAEQGRAGQGRTGQLT